MQAAGSSMRRSGAKFIVRALLISLAIHALLFGVWETGNRYNLWKTNRLFRWVKQTLLSQPELTSAVQKLKQPEPQQDFPLVFVDVDPQTAVTEPPENTKYYSALSSKAANTDPTIETEKPKIDGQQTKVPKAFDTLRADASPPKPLPQPPAPTEQKAESRDQRAEKPAPGGQSPGDLAMAKPRPNSDLSVTDSDGQAKKEAEEHRQAPARRPTSLAQAKLKQGIVVAEKMKQEGGVLNHGNVALDVKGTSFGAYDAAIVAAVQSRWFALLDERKFAGDNVGKVVLEFRLNQDGRITEMKVGESDVGELLALLCQKAILDPSPYGPWPNDMRRLIGASFRDVRFTFYY